MHGLTVKMIAGFRKPKRNFSGSLRKKIVTDTEDEDGEEKGPTPPTISLKTKAASQPSQAGLFTTSSSTVKSKKQKDKIGKPKGLLSFEDDLEDGEEFQIKKSKESKMLSKMVEEERKRKKKKKKASDNLIDDRVSQLQEEAVNTPSGSPLGSTNGSASQSPTPIYTEEIRTLDENEIEQFESLQFSNVKVGLSSGVIPDAATIYALKKKREMARQLGTGTDYVPVDDTVKYEGRFVPGKSRLVREDDGDGSDDERMEFKGLENSGKSFPALERRKEVAQALEEAHDESDQDKDEELHEWEREQIRKGVAIPAAQSEPSYGPQIPTSFGQEIPFLEAPQVLTGSVDADSFASTSSSLPLPPMPPIVFGFPGIQSSVSQGQVPFMQTFSETVTVEMVTQRLQERLSSVEQVHRAHKLEHDKVKMDLESSESNVTTLERNSLDVSDRFTFYQDIFGYVKDLIECLNEKVSITLQTKHMLMYIVNLKCLYLSSHSLDTVDFRT